MLPLETKMCNGSVLRSRASRRCQRRRQPAPHIHRAASACVHTDVDVDACHVQLRLPKVLDQRGLGQRAVQVAPR